MVLLAHQSSKPKWHLDRFSHFCRAHNCDRPEDRPRHSICNSRPHLDMYAVLQCGLRKGANGPDPDPPGKWLLSCLFMTTATTTSSVNILTFWTFIENREEINDYGCCVEDRQKSQPWLQLFSLHIKLPSVHSPSSLFFSSPLYSMSKRIEPEKQLISLIHIALAQQAACTYIVVSYSLHAQQLHTVVLLH